VYTVKDVEEIENIESAVVLSDCLRTLYVIGKQRGFLSMSHSAKEASVEVIGVIRLIV
jgi:hypothetical protein